MGVDDDGNSTDYYLVAVGHDRDDNEQYCCHTADTSLERRLGGQDVHEKH